MAEAWSLISDVARIVTLSDMLLHLLAKVRLYHHCIRISARRPPLWSSCWLGLGDHLSPTTVVVESPVRLQRKATDPSTGALHSKGAIVFCRSWASRSCSCGRDVGSALLRLRFVSVPFGCSGFRSFFALFWLASRLLFSWCSSPGSVPVFSSLFLGFLVLFVALFWPPGFCVACCGPDVVEKFEEHTGADPITEPSAGIHRDCGWHGSEVFHFWHCLASVTGSRSFLFRLWTRSSCRCCVIGLPTFFHFC